MSHRVADPMSHAVVSQTSINCKRICPAYSAFRGLGSEPWRKVWTVAMRRAVEACFLTTLQICEYERRFAVTASQSDEKNIVKALLEGMILKHEAKRWANA